MATRQGTLTRAIAIDALNHTLNRHIHADEALNRLFEHNKEHLSALDRAFVFEMVYGSLRWLAKMDWIMQHMVDRPFASLDPRVANALRVGTYQIYYMDKVPARAAVSETVEATKKVGAGNASSFVNAVLRRIARKAEYFPKPDKVERAADYYAMHTSHPKWMVERWMKHIPTERLEHLLSGNNQPPQQSLRALKRNPLPLEGDDLATHVLREFGVASEYRPLKGVVRVEELPPLGLDPAFAKGCYIVQDEAAQLAASLVCAAPTDKVLDACAAPGGKTIDMWDDGLEAENLYVADRAQKRIRVMEQNFTRVGLKGAHILHGDVVETAGKDSFDKILLDAPCSAMGVIRRHPEIKWHRSPADILSCAKEQKRLLDGLAPAVKPGGELVYVVCSIEMEETTEQMEIFLKEHPEFESVSLDNRIHDWYRRYVTRRHELLILPGNSDNLDGFYAMVLRRKS